MITDAKYETMGSCRRWMHRLGNSYCASPFQQLSWLAAISLFGLLIYYRVYVHFSYNHLESERFVEADKCPACFGTSLCRRFRRGDFKFHSYHSIRMLDFINVKNVYFATYLDQTAVVLKKLGHNDEHRQFDEDICTHVEGKEDTCDVAEQIHHSKLSDVVYADALQEKDVMGLSDIVRCPSERLLEKIWNSFGERQSDGTLSKNDKLMLVTSLAFNPEPIILQTFPAKDGWPFPSYMGACGRFVAEEYSGRTLSYFHTFQFNTRAALAVQILKIAEKLTENTEEYALYMTDVSPDNFAVTPKGSVLIVDAENIIVVDKKKIRDEAKTGWDAKHQSEHTGCGSKKECIMFSHTELCDHYYSDHNYYAVCQGLFGKNSPYGEDGLLHSIPSDLSPRMTGRVKDLIKECRDPVTKGGRYVAAKELRTVLMPLII